MKINPFTKTYKKTTVLSFPGITLNQGTIYTVIGANGSGKSTFARILSGILPPDRKEAVFSPPPASIGYMPQKSFAFRMSVLNNVLLNGGKTSASERAKASEFLNSVGLTALAGHNGSHLSGGETARLALARLFMRPYELLVLDEPTASLDIASTIQTEQLIRQYCKATNASIILITHNLKQARRISDQVLFFKNGSLADSGAPDSLLSCPQNPALREFVEFYSL